MRSRRNWDGTVMTDRDRRNDPLCLFDKEGYPKDFTPPEGFDPDTYFESQGYGVSKTDKFGDPNAPQVRDYYTGYDEKVGEQQYADPFADNPYKYEPERPVQKLIEPQKRVATPKDGVSRYLVTILLGAAFLLFNLCPFIVSIAEHVSDESFISTSATAEGHITRENYIRIRRSLIRHNYVHYEFTANDGNVYEGSDDLSQFQKTSLGYSNVGTKVIVYYDPEYPSRSKLVAQDFASRIPTALIGIFVGGVLLVSGIIVLNRFRNGGYIVEEYGGKKIIKKLK